jgi:hypothetical protein
MPTLVTDGQPWSVRASGVAMALIAAAYLLAGVARPSRPS